MMGNDAHCAAWIARHGESPSGEARRRAARGGARGPQAAAASDVSDERSSSSRRRGGAAAFERGTTVLDAARRLGVDLDSVCGGRGICGRCQVEVAEGEHAKHGIMLARARTSRRR